MFKFLKYFQKPKDLNQKLVFSLTRPRVPKLAELKVLPGLLTPSERWIMRVASAILILAGITGLAMVARRHLERVPQPGGSYREAVVGTARLINPILAASDVDRDITRLVYSGLLGYNENGELTPDLAQEYTVEKNGLDIRFTLRENLKFHDGEPLTAQDVLFTINAIKNQTWQSPLWRAFQDVTVEAPDPRTITVKVQAVRASFPHLFTVGILPKHIWENVDPESARLAIWNIKPVGSGPYQFASIAKSRDGALRAYQLKRFPEYYRGTPFIKEIALVFFHDFEGALSALRQHEVEGVSFIPERLREKLSLGGARLLKSDFSRFTALFFQDRKSEILKERAVRQSLARAIDRTAIAALVPDAREAFAPFVEGDVGFVRAMSNTERSLDGAAKLLEGAGWKRGKDGWTKNKKQLAITLTAPDEPVYLLVADAIKRNWEELGVQVKLEAVPKATFEREVLRPRAYEVLLFSLVGSGDPDPYPFWHSTQADDQGLALSSVKVREMDAVLEQGRSTLDPAARFRAYLRFSELLRDEVPGIILYSSPYVYAISKRVRGVDHLKLITPSDRFSGVEKWFMRSRPGWK